MKVKTQAVKAFQEKHVMSESWGTFPRNHFNCLYMNFKFISLTVITTGNINIFLHIPHTTNCRLAIPHLCLFIGLLTNHQIKCRYYFFSSTSNGKFLVPGAMTQQLDKRSGKKRMTIDKQYTHIKPNRRQKETRSLVQPF